MRAIQANVLLSVAAFFGLLVAFPVNAFAHGVTDGDKGYISEISGVHIMPFIYLGAKHMMTGYDHLLFLFGVISFSIVSRMSGSMSRCLPLATL